MEHAVDSIVARQLKETQETLAIRNQEVYSAQEKLNNNIMKRDPWTLQRFKEAWEYSKHNPKYLKVTLSKRWLRYTKIRGKLLLKGFGAN